MTLLLYVMKIIPLVSAAELKMAACARGILQDSKALLKMWPFVNLDTKDFACKWRSDLSIIWAVSQFHSLPAAAWSFIWASLTAVGFKARVQAISHCLSLYLCSNLGKYKSGADANLGYLISHYKQYGLKPVQFNQVCKCMAYIGNLIMQRQNGRLLPFPWWRKSAPYCIMAVHVQAIIMLKNVFSRQKCVFFV